MKNKVLLSAFFALIISLFMTQSSLYASGEAVSPELIAKGKELFNSKEGLGVKFACILCHKQDKAVKLSKINGLGDKFPSVINNYITQKSKGKPLAPDSEEMKALIAYIQHEHAK